MRRSNQRVETIKKVIKIPDELIEKMDEEVLMDYVTRSDFMAEAIRNLTSVLINKWFITLDVHGKDCPNPDVMDEFIFSRMKEGLQEYRDKADEYSIEEFTPITAYLTEHQLNDIHYFVRDGSPIKNLQVFCRIAIITNLENRELQRKGRWALIP